MLAMPRGLTARCISAPAIGLALACLACAGCGSPEDPAQPASSPAEPGTAPPPGGLSREPPTGLPTTAPPASPTAPAGTPAPAAESSTRLADFRDGTSGTILVGTVPADRAVSWTKPEDIAFNASFPDPETGNAFDEGYFMFADGSVKYVHVEEGMDRDVFRGLFTIAGGEPRGPNDLYPPGHQLTFPQYATAEESLQATKARTDSMNSLKRIALAMHNYHQVYGHFPPASLPGPDGKPWHSWRVLILPLVGEPALYKQYDQTVPWDDARNAAVLNAMPAVYRDSFSQDAAQTTTRYLAITGPGTAFPQDSVVQAAAE